jgi:predicted nucleic acid-binding protein
MVLDRPRCKRQVALQVIAEVERNLERKVPRALPAFRMLVSRCLRIVADPLAADVLANSGLADGKDLPLLLVALREGCSWLISFNLRHYAPGHPSVAVLRPGDVVLRVRDLLAQMSWN